METQSSQTSFPLFFLLGGRGAAAMLLHNNNNNTRIRIINPIATVDENYYSLASVVVVVVLLLLQHTVAHRFMRNDISSSSRGLCWTNNKKSKLPPPRVENTFEKDYIISFDDRLIYASEPTPSIDWKVNTFQSILLKQQQQQQRLDNINCYNCSWMDGAYLQSYSSALCLLFKGLFLLLININMSRDDAARFDVSFLLACACISMTRPPLLRSTFTII